MSPSVVMDSILVCVDQERPQWTAGRPSSSSREMPFWKGSAVRSAAAAVQILSETRLLLCLCTPLLPLIKELSEALTTLTMSMRGAQIWEFKDNIKSPLPSEGVRRILSSQ